MSTQQFYVSSTGETGVAVSTSKEILASFEVRVVGGESRLDRKLRDVLEVLTGSLNDQADIELFRAFIKEQGGLLKFAKELIGENRFAQLRRHFRKVRIDPDYSGPKCLPDLMYRPESNSSCSIERELRDIDFRLRLDAKMYRALHVREDHKVVEARNQVDWDAVHDYSDIKPYNPFKGAYLGKRPESYTPPTRHKVRNEDGTIGEIELRHGGGLLERWIPNFSIRILKDGKISKERLLLTDFGPWSVVSETTLVKQFNQRWFQDKRQAGNLLGVAKIPMSGDATRYGGVMLLPQDWQKTRLVEKFTFGKEKVLKDGQLVLKDCQLVLVCPMNVKGDAAYRKSMEPKKVWPKTGKLVIGKGHSWITLKKVSDGVLEATLWRTIEQSNGNAVTRISRATYTPWEWGKQKRDLLRDGWTESRV